MSYCLVWWGGGGDKPMAYERIRVRNFTKYKSRSRLLLMAQPTWSRRRTWQTSQQTTQLFAHAIITRQLTRLALLHLKRFQHCRYEETVTYVHGGTCTEWIAENTVEKVLFLRICMFNLGLNVGFIWDVSCEFNILL